MRNILVPVSPDGRMQPVFEAARLVADAFGGTVEGVALGPDLPEVLSSEFLVTAPTLDADAQRDLIAQARGRFEEFMRSAGVPRHAEGAEGASWIWMDGLLATDMQVGSIGRLFDLLVLGRPSTAGDPTRTATVEAALFESGRPLLLVPPGGAASIGRRIVIAWNGSTETARTVALAAPILARAESVSVLTVEGWHVDGPSGEGLARTLKRNGVAAEAITRDMRNSPGQAVMEHARSLGADLVVKGAYTQSRLRQMIFGGATRHIIANADLPVFIAH